MFKQVTARFGLVALGVVLALCVSEAVVRTLDLAPELERLRLTDVDSAYQLSDNVVLGYEFKKGYRHSNPDSHSTFASINSHGFRDIERVHKKAPGTRRILVLGDSVVAGHGIRDLNNTIPRQLELLFQTTEPRVEVLNLGVGGYCTAGEVEMLVTRGLAYDPDVVVLVFVENDYDDLNSELARLRDNSGPSWTDSLAISSELFRLLAYKIGALSVPEQDSELVKAHMDAVGDRNVDQGVRRLAAVAQTGDVSVLIAVWPRFTDSQVVNAESGRVVSGGSTLRIEEIAKANSIPLMRLSPAFRAALQSGENPRRRFAQQDGMHPSEAGARVAARALYERLAAELSKSKFVK